MEVVVLGVLLAIATVVAIFLGLQVGPARAAASNRTKELESVRIRLAQIEADLKKNSEALGNKRKEAEELKERLRDTKRRRHEEKEAARLKKDIQEAREEIERDMEKKLGLAREEAEEAKAQLKKLAMELEALQARRVSAVASNAISGAVAAENRPAAPAVMVETPRESFLEERARAERAEKALTEVRQKVEDIASELKKAKGRAETDKRVFLVQKGEIDLAKDKYRAIEARFNALSLERDELKKSVWLLEKERKSLMPVADKAVAVAETGQDLQQSS